MPAVCQVLSILSASYCVVARSPSAGSSLVLSHWLSKLRLAGGAGGAAEAEAV